MISTAGRVEAPSLRHLRVYEKVAELKGIGKASVALALSQPAVTQAIEKIEAQLGVTLLERRSRGTFTNASGQILHGRTRRMFQMLEEGLRDFGVARDHDNGVTSVTRRISRKQILALATVANSPSFAEAARRLGISAVSLHRAARDLERTLGKVIFREVSTGTITTPAGTALARRAFLALREIDWAIEEIRALHGELGGQLRVGAMPRAGSYLLGAALNALDVHFPAAQVNADIASGVHLTKALLRGDIDLLVGMHDAGHNSGELKQMPLLDSPFVLVGRQGHPLSGIARVGIQDMKRYQWIAPNKAAARRAIFEDIFARMQGDHPPVIEANAFSTTRMLIAGSERLTLMTQYEFDQEAGSGGLAVLPMAPIDSGHVLGVMWRSNWEPSPLHQKFLDLLQIQADLYKAEIADADGRRSAAAMMQ